MTLVRSVFIAAGVAALGLKGALAEDSSRLVALSACPNVAKGCIEMVVHWDFARTDRPLYVDDAGAGTRALKVRGRLGAARVRAFELVISSAKAARRNYLGEVAYLGRSRDGRPIVVTDRGPLAIETRGLQVGRSGAVVVIDERAGAVVQSFLGGLDGGTYVFEGPEHISAVTKTGTCLSPPLSRPGALTAAAACDDRRAPPDGLKFSEALNGAIDAAPGVDLAMIRKLLPQTRELDDVALRAKVGRLDATHLVVTPWSD
jgi:hypothetical protein